MLTMMKRTPVLMCSRAFSSSSTVHRPIEVMVSQSVNQLANSALEAWLRRSKNFKHRNVLFLSSSNSNKGRNIKACFLNEEEETGGAQAAASLVLQSIPQDVALSELPEVVVDEGSVRVSLPLDHPEEKSVRCTLQNIADRFTETSAAQEDDKCSVRVSLVSPDRGWFPGIQEIQDDLETNLRELAAIRRIKQQESNSRIPPSFNSFGSYL